MRYFIPLLLVFFAAPLFAQEDSIPAQPVDSIRPKLRKEITPGADNLRDSSETGIRDYRIISYSRDTVHLDTSLTIEKEYAFNYLRRDDFELMPFANVGQPYNRLGADLDRPSYFPGIGADARHFNYLEKEDIGYYNVATPVTDLFFKTTFEQGQLLDAMLTFNTSERFNFSIAYKGFRSLGKYQHSQGESGNFRTTANYRTSDGRYWLRAHIAAQDILGEENGGLLLEELQFESEDPDFADRSRVDVFFSNAENKILGKRYFLEQQFELFGQGGDTASGRRTSLALGHEFMYETKYYQFQQLAANAYFGEAIQTPVDDKANLKTMYNELRAIFSNPVMGSLSGYTGIYSYNYFFNSLLLTDSGQIDNQLKGEEITLGARYANTVGGIEFGGDAAYTSAGDLTGHRLQAFARYLWKAQNRIVARVHSSSRMPDYNYLLYQSDYLNYNWQNTGTFEKEKVNSLSLDINFAWLGNLFFKYSTSDNFSYFTSVATDEQVSDDLENAYVRPFQEGNTVNHLKIRYGKEFRIGNWALNNTLMYQHVSQANEVLNLPQWVSRNTLYYSSHIFKRAMYLQTGVSFKYFTEYPMDAYNPLLAEFYVQRREELGGFPMLDFFINARIRQTRIYLKAEHFNSSFTGNTFYAAPGYPYRDFVIRFGLVWNFFS